MTTYTREEVLRLLGVRRGLGEGQGDGAFIELTMRVTPEVLAEAIGSTITFPDGRQARIASVSVERGYAELIFEPVP